MTREEFILLTNEDPIDVLGIDWEQYADAYIYGDPNAEEYDEGDRCPECGNLPNEGACYYCKQD